MRTEMVKLDKSGISSQWLRSKLYSPTLKLMEIPIYQLPCFMVQYDKKSA